MSANHRFFVLLLVCVPAFGQESDLLEPNVTDTGSEAEDLEVTSLLGIHGILMFLAFGLFMPLGIWPPFAWRLPSEREKHKRFIEIHFGLLTLAFLLAIAGIACAINAKIREGGFHFAFGTTTRGAHIILGWILLGLFFFQFCMGWGAACLLIWEWRLRQHWMTGVLLPVNAHILGQLEVPSLPRERCVPVTLHIWLGRLIIVLVIVQLFLGLAEWAHHASEFEAQALAWGLVGWW